MYLILLIEHLLQQLLPMQMNMYNYTANVIVARVADTEHTKVNEI